MFDQAKGECNMKIEMMDDNDVGGVNDPPQIRSGPGFCTVLDVFELPHEHHPRFRHLSMSAQQHQDKTFLRVEINDGIGNRVTFDVTDIDHIAVMAETLLEVL